MSNFFTILGLILSILGAIVSAVIIFTVFVYFVWLLLNPSQAKQKLQGIKTWAKQWLPTNKKKGNGISKLLIFIILFVLAIIGFAIWYIYTYVNIEDDFNRPWWVWGICILVAAIGTYSYLVIKKKIPWGWKLGFPKWARWLFVGLAIAGVILWFLWPSIGLRFYFGKSDAASIATNSRPTQSTTSSQSAYSRLNTKGKKNTMKKDEPYVFEFPISQSKKEYHLVFSTPKGDTTTVILTYQHGDDTWRRKLWRDALDKPQSELLDIRPAPFSGACEVRADKDCRVVVELKEVGK
jgi:hypothetical protein